MCNEMRAKSLTQFAENETLNYATTTTELKIQNPKGHRRFECHTAKQ